LSIAKQDYPKELIQTLIVDGGSTDSTLDIAMESSNATVVSNTLRTGEAGKAVGVAYARNAILAFIDSDNILDDPSWLRRMTGPFSDPEIVASEPLYFSHHRNDPMVTRYCALAGANDPLTIYLGNHDRYSFIDGCWTELSIDEKDCGDYLSVDLRASALPTFGSNGFLVLKEVVDMLIPSRFLFDVDMVVGLAEMGGLRIAKVKVGITHIFAYNVLWFLRKSYRRIRDHEYYQTRGLRRYPWTTYPRIRFLKFVLFSLTFLGTLRDARRGCRRFPDLAWLFHPFACFCVTIIYATVIMANPSNALLFMKRLNGRGPNRSGN
jgi:glycosyltransferase involved in cell wall biosynthesis